MKDSYREMSPLSLLQAMTQLFKNVGMLNNMVLASRASGCLFGHPNLKKHPSAQCLSQDLETGCLKLAVVKFLGVQIFKGDHSILILQP